ncbi:MAG: hypothetical protein ACPKQO_02685 [Nitrososphaeraceae archaeon]
MGDPSSAIAVSFDTETPKSDSSIPGHSTVSQDTYSGLSGGAGKPKN